MTPSRTPEICVFRPSPRKNDSISNQNSDLSNGDLSPDTELQNGDSDTPDFPATHELTGAFTQSNPGMDSPTEDTGSARRELTFDSPDRDVAPAAISSESESSYSPSFEGQQITTGFVEPSQSSDDSMPPEDAVVSDKEIEDLYQNLAANRSQSFNATCSNEFIARSIATDDFWSALFSDPSESLWEDLSLCDTDADTEESASPETVSDEQRNQANRRGGIQGWKYSSPFENTEIRVDDADELLGERYVHEANTILENIVQEAQVISKPDEVITASSLSPLRIMDLFLPESLLEKLKAHINRVLKNRGQTLVSVPEIKGVIVTHILAASYNSSVSTITSPENQDFFFQTGLNGSRYLEIWSAMSCTTRKRQQVQAVGVGWSNKPILGNQLITELEQEVAAINRALIYIPGRTIFSLDDDHQRLRSRAVTDLTNLSQINNPQKTLGPVNNAVCSALTSVFIANHYSRPSEKLIHVWERLVQLIQGAATPGSITPMTDSIFAADRGYNGKETIDFLNERLGATGIGTHKRSLDFPFVFGDGPIRKRHKGMVVSEKGCRAVYTATRSPTGKAGRNVQAVVYRESYTGRIAAIYHNNNRMFGAHTFTLIPKPSYRRRFSKQDLTEMHEVYRSSTSSCRAITRSNETDTFIPFVKVSLVLSNVTHFTDCSPV